MTIDAPGAPDAARREAAAAAVRAHLRPSPLVAADDLAPGALLKLESLLPTGSFKVRGALAACAATQGPLVTASAGNHGLGMAFAAAHLGRDVVVVVPGDASEAKVARLRGLGVEPVRAGAGYDAAEAEALAIAHRTGARFVSPYDDPDVIAGQHTVGREIGDELAGPLLVVVPVGGGGLAAGVVLWAAGRSQVRVVGVEAAASTAMAASLRAGRVARVAVGPTVADGLAGNLAADASTPGILAAGGIALTAVSDGEILRAVAHLHRAHGIVAEGAGAVAVAALLAGRVAPQAGERLVALVTGSNLTGPVLARALALPVPG